MTLLDTNAAWSDGLHAVHAEAAGVMHLDIIQPPDLDGLIAATLMGDDRTRSLLTAIDQALAAIENAPRRRPMLCACCPRPIRPGGAFTIAIARPARRDVTKVVSLAVCASCATEREDARSKALAALRRIWPDARPLKVHHKAGRA